MIYGSPHLSSYCRKGLGYRVNKSRKQCKVSTADFPVLPALVRFVQYRCGFDLLPISHYLCLNQLCPLTQKIVFFFKKCDLLVGDFIFDWRLCLCFAWGEPLLYLLLVRLQRPLQFHTDKELGEYVARVPQAHTYFSGRGWLKSKPLIVLTVARQAAGREWFFSQFFFDTQSGWMGRPSHIFLRVQPQITSYLWILSIHIKHFLKDLLYLTLVPQQCESKLWSRFKWVGVVCRDGSYLFFSLTLLQICHFWI